MKLKSIVLCVETTHMLSGPQFWSFQPPHKLITMKTEISTGKYFRLHMQYTIRFQIHIILITRPGRSVIQRCFDGEVCRTSILRAAQNINFNLNLNM